MRQPRIAIVVALFALGCGSAGASGPSSRTARTVGEPPLDWAMLLPIETDGVVRLDLARMRRSPHRESLQPVFDQLLSGVADPAMQEGLAGLIERTDLVLVAFVPAGPDEEDEILILARGGYAPDEIERLNAATSDGQGSRAIEVRGRRVWIGADPEDPTAMAQLRPDTLALTADSERMERLIARIGMPAGTPRWPPSLRALIEATRLEEATFGLALANRSMGEEMGEPMTMSLAGTADADGPLDLEVLIELGDPGLAAAGAVFFEAMIRELAGAAGGESFALGSLARMARIEASGTRVRGSIHADRTEAQQLVPGLMGLLRDGLSEEEAEPDILSPMPTPL